MLKLISLIYYVLSFFILISSYFYSLFILKFKKRIQFENKNSSDPYSISFSKDKKIADIAFEVSSEGEFEQVVVVIEYFLTKGALVELIYCSDSLEKKISTWKTQYQNLRVLRLPLLTVIPFIKSHSLSSWLTAKKLILCRYDFYPEIIFYGFKRDVKFILLSASLKSLSAQQNTLYFSILKKIYKSFDLVVCSTFKDFEMFKLTFEIEKEKLDIFDFRIISIKNRLLSSDKTLNSKFNLELFKNKLNQYDSKLILGNFWPDELPIIDSKIIKELKSNNLFLTIVPHETDDATIDNISAYLKSFSLKPEVINNSNMNSYKFESNVLIVQLRGILCELYGLHTCSYVGGGFGKSVHSILEPFLSSIPVICGPHIQKSTEFDISYEAFDQGVKAITSKTDFAYNIFSDYNKEKRNSYVESFFKRNNELLRKIKEI